MIRIVLRNDIRIPFMSQYSKSIWRYDRHYRDKTVTIRAISTRNRIETVYYISHDEIVSTIATGRIVMGVKIVPRGPRVLQEQGEIRTVLLALANVSYLYCVCYSSLCMTTIWDRTGEAAREIAWVIRSRALFIGVEQLPKRYPDLQVFCYIIS